MDKFETELLEMLSNIVNAIKNVNITIQAFIAKMEALQPDLEYKEDPRIIREKLIVKEEPQVSEEIIVEYEGRTYKKFKPCKYKCGFWASWATDYKQGDKILHINPMTKEIVGFNCPKFEGG